MEVGGKRADYTAGAIGRLLVNWCELEEAESEPAVIYKWDIEQALDCLPDEDRKVAFTVMSMGERAFLSGPLTEEEERDVRRRAALLVRRLGVPFVEEGFHMAPPSVRLDFVSSGEFEQVKRRLFKVLNREGIVPKWNAALVRLQVERSRPFTPYEICMGATRYGED